MKTLTSKDESTRIYFADDGVVIVKNQITTLIPPDLYASLMADVATSLRTRLEIAEDMNERIGEAVAENVREEAAHLACCDSAITEIHAIDIQKLTADTLAELSANIAEPSSIVAPGIYQHFKGGSYEVYGVAEPGDIDAAQFISTAVHSETRETVLVYVVLAIPTPLFLVAGDAPMVLYRPTYGEKQLTMRPLSMWSDHVEREGYSGPRFTLKEQNQ